MTDVVTWTLVIIVVLAGIPISIWLHLSEMKRQGRDADTLLDLDQPTPSERAREHTACGWRDRGEPYDQAKDAS